MLIGLDLDGVTIDFDRGWVERYNEWFDTDISIDRVRRYARWHAFSAFTHFPSSTEFWAWAMQVPNFWLRMEPVPGALGGVSRLLEMGHTFKVVTHRHPSAYRETHEWMTEHWPNGQPPELFLGVDKASIPCDLWIDDGPHVVKDLYDQGKHVVRYARPYNARVDASAVVENWGTFVRYVDTVALLNPNWVSSDEVRKQLGA